MGPTTTDFKDLYLGFTQDSHTYTLKGIHVDPPQIISSHRVEKLLKKGYSGIISQFNAIQVLDSPTQEVPTDSQLLLNKHQQVFEMPKDLPPSLGKHDHGIPLIPGSQPPKFCPYRHPFAQKNEEH